MLFVLTRKKYFKSLKTFFVSLISFTIILRGCSEEQNMFQSLAWNVNEYLREGAEKSDNELALQSKEVIVKEPCKPAQIEVCHRFQAVDCIVPQRK